MAKSEPKAMETLKPVSVEPLEGVLVTYEVRATLVVSRY